MSAFTWIPFYQELADKLLAYQGRQSELIAILKKLKDQGCPITAVADKDRNVWTVPHKPRTRNRPRRCATDRGGHGGVSAGDKESHEHRLRHGKKIVIIVGHKLKGLRHVDAVRIIAQCTALKEGEK